MCFVFFEIGGQRDAFERRGFVGCIGAQGGAPLYEAARFLQTGLGCPGRPVARIERRGGARAHFELDARALGSALLVSEFDAVQVQLRGDDAFAVGVD